MREKWRDLWLCLLFLVLALVFTGFVVWSEWFWGVKFFLSIGVLACYALFVSGMSVWFDRFGGEEGE